MQICEFLQSVLTTRAKEEGEEQLLLKERDARVENTKKPKKTVTALFAKPQQVILLY